MFRLSEFLKKLEEDENQKDQPSDSGSDAGEEARKLGLTHLGRGYYGKNGQATHQSVDGKLKPVEPKDAPQPDGDEVRQNPHTGMKYTVSRPPGQKGPSAADTAPTQQPSKNPSNQSGGSFSKPDSGGSLSQPAQSAQQLSPEDQYTQQIRGDADKEVTKFNGDVDKAFQEANRRVSYWRDEYDRRSASKQSRTTAPHQLKAAHHFLTWARDVANELKNRVEANQKLNSPNPGAVPSMKSMVPKNQNPEPPADPVQLAKHYYEKYGSADEAYMKLADRIPDIQEYIREAQHEGSPETVQRFQAILKVYEAALLELGNKGEEQQNMDPERGTFGPDN
jgi:hypothetical protein